MVEVDSNGCMETIVDVEDGVIVDDELETRDDVDV